VCVQPTCGICLGSDRAAALISKGCACSESVLVHVACLADAALAQPDLERTCGTCSCMLGGEVAEGVLAMMRENATLAVDVSRVKALSDRGKHTDALPIAAQVASAHAHSRGNGHPIAVTAQSALASCLSALGRHSEADAMYRGILYTGTPDSIAIVNRYGHRLIERGELANALSVLRKARGVSSRVLGASSPITRDLERSIEICLAVISAKCSNPVCNVKATSLCCRCNMTGYCSRACQVTDWPRHKTQCG